MIDRREVRAVVGPNATDSAVPQVVTDREFSALLAALAAEVEAFVEAGSGGVQVLPEDAAR